MSLSDIAPLRIVQWTTGNVGQRSVRAITTHPELPAVNAYNELPQTLPRGVVRL